MKATRPEQPLAEGRQSIQRGNKSTWNQVALQHSPGGGAPKVQPLWHQGVAGIPSAALMGSLFHVELHL